MSVEDIDIKVKEEVEVVDLEDESSTTNLMSTVNCTKEIIRDPGKGVIVLRSRVSLQQQTLEGKREVLDKKNGLVRKQNEPAEEKRAKLDRKTERVRKQNETAEQKRARLDWNKELRRRQQQNETPEQRCQRLAKNREHQRLYQLRLKEWQKNETPEQKRQKLAKNAEAQRLYQLRLKEKISEGLEHQFLSNRKHIDMTDDELAEECKQILVEKRDKWGHKVKWDEAPDGKLLMTREKMESVKTAYIYFLWKKKKEDQMSAEELARKKEAVSFKKLVKSAHMTEEERWRKRMVNYLRRHAWEDSMSEERREKHRQRHIAKCSRYYHNMTEEQRKRHMIAQNRATKKYVEKNREKLKIYYKQKIVNQTPEQRQKYLQYNRISQARRLLKRKLEAAGIPHKEIQKQVDQLVSKMKSEPLPPLEKLSSYQPRPRKKQRSEMETQTSSIKKFSDQDCRNLNIISTTSQIESPLGSLSQDLEGCISSSSHLDPPSPSLSQSSSIIQEQISGETLDEEGDMEDYKNDDDTIATPAHLPPPSPTPSFYNDQDCSIVKKASVRMQETIDVRSVERNPSPLLICQLPALPSAAPSIPATCTSLSSLLNEKKCPHCPSSFPEDSQLQSHVHSSHQNKCWKCPKCSSVVLSSEELREHFKSHHAKPEPRVEVNPKTTTMKIRRKSEVNLDQLKRSKPKQVSKSVKTLPFICMKCPCSSPISKSAFETVDQLFNHVRISHPKAFWPCPQCKLLKYNQATLKVHSKICTKRLNS